MNRPAAFHLGRLLLDQPDDSDLIVRALFRKGQVLSQHLFYLGGNGHCAARLTLAREALARRSAEGQLAPFELVDLPYPGFEGRPRAASFDAFLASVSGSMATAVERGGRGVLYGTGIGGLLALCLRARGEWLDLPLLMQAPVLWGLEHRLMPRLMRLGLGPLLPVLFARGWFQRRFVRRQFERPPSPQMQAAFFEGYARCAAGADFFRWLTPGLLRQLVTHRLQTYPSHVHRRASTPLTEIWSLR